MPAPNRDRQEADLFHRLVRSCLPNTLTIKKFLFHPPSLRVLTGIETLHSPQVPDRTSVEEGNKIMHRINLRQNSKRGLLGLALFAALALLGPSHATAQTSIVGGLGNFDAANNEGKDAHGFEVQLEGIQLKDLYPAWCGNKYGCPIVVPYATGVYVRYMSPYDAASASFTATTIPKAAGTPFAGTCYNLSPTNTTGCDHFGVHLGFVNATATSYRWMFADPANPGQLIASTNNIFVPTPIYTWVINPVPAAPPILVVEVQVPDPPAPQFGNATWMKVYKNELNREVFLDELVDTNAIVPQTAAQVETEWVLMQQSPVSNGNRRRRNRHVNSGGVANATRSVIRRYETYAYTGTYNPLTHEVTCGGDATCNIPQPGELGDLLVAQMAAANVAVPSMTVTVTGIGNVSSADKIITCGSKCSAVYALGAVVTLTATPGSKSVFSAWSGACNGATPTCTATINDALTTTATFVAAPATGGGGGGGGTGGTTQFTLSIGRSNVGTVSSDLPGIDCGNACSAKFNAGTSVTLTATPPAGKTFVNWSGGCSGTNNVCTLPVNANVSVQAVFSK